MSKHLPRLLSSTTLRLGPGSRSVMSAAIPKSVKPSATLIVAAPTTSENDDSDYRVLMMKRNAKSSFINAHVFPGGVVDPADQASLWHPILPSTQDEALMTYKICAIRETFEESGLLLTHPPAYTVLKDTESAVWRERVHADATQFKILCETHKLQPATDKLLLFANWITPVNEKRRYNTHFFLTVLDPPHRAFYAADGKELVQLDWFTPKQALTAWEQRKIVLFPPQWYCLHAMNQVPQYQNLASSAGMGALRRRDGSVSTVLPQPGQTPDDHPMAKSGHLMFLAYPGDECYRDPFNGGRLTGRPGDRHRIYIRGRMQDFVLEKNVDVSDIIDSSAHL